MKTVSKLPAGLQFLPRVPVNADGELHQIGWFLGSFSGISCRSTFCFLFLFFTASHIKHKTIAQEILISNEDRYTQKRVDEPWVLGLVPSNPVWLGHCTWTPKAYQCFRHQEMYPGKHCLKTAPRGAVRKGYEPCSNGSRGTGSTRGQV